jgi:hypothetical protein
MTLPSEPQPQPEQPQPPTDQYPTGGYAHTAFPVPPPNAPTPPYPPTAPTKKGMSTRKILLIVGAGLLALCCIGGIAVFAIGGSAVKKAADAAASATPAKPTAAPATTAAATTPADAGPKTMNIGDTAQIAGGDGAAGTITVSAPANRKGALDGKNYVVVTVDIACTSGSIAYNPLYFKLKDAGGVEYNTGFFGGLGDELKSGDLPAGQKVHGTVGFEAPAAALHGSLVELSNAGLQTIGYWKLP